MIRWRYILTRVLIVVVVIVLFRWALSPAVRLATIHGLQYSTGSRVEIGEAHVDLWPPRVYYENVNIANPRREMSDAVQADLLDIQLSTSALLRRQYVIDKARVTGIVVGGDRTTSGRLESVAPSPNEAASGSGFADKLTGVLNGFAKDKASAIADSFETPRVSQDVRNRWKSEYESLAARAKQLENDVRTVRDNVQGIDNPLRDLPQLQQALTQAEAIRQELLSVRKSIDDMPSAIQADMQRVDQARQNDLRQIGQYVPGLSGEDAEFSPDMFRQLVATQLQRVRELIDGSRSLADWTVVSPQNERMRGVDFNFPYGKLAPNWLVRQTEVSGKIQVDGRQYDLQGVLENLSGQPERVGGPLVGRLKLDGPQVARIDFKRHQNEEGSWDEVTMHWPQLPVDSLAVGDPGKAAISIQPGGLELWVTMNVKDDVVNGRMVSRMRNTQIATDVQSNKYNQALVTSLTSALEDVREVNVEAQFGGKWDSSMRINVASNLSHVFSSAVKNSLNSQVAATKQQLTTKVDETYRKQVSELQQWLTQQQAAVRKSLSIADTSVEEVSSKLVQQLGAPDLYLGRLRRGLQLPKF